MNMRYITPLIALALLVVAARPAAAAEDAADIMMQAHIANYYAGDDGKARVHMEIVNPDGGTRVRDFVILRTDISDGGDQWFFVYFEKPNDVRDMTFLVNKHPDSPDDRWLFIPSIRMVKRIAPSDARTAFVGSDYTYEDISGRHPSEDVQEMLDAEAELDGRATWLIKNTPKEPTGDYAYRHTWVDKKTRLVLRESYFDESGDEVRRFTTDEFRKIGDYWVGTAGTMVDLEVDHRTTVRFTDVELDIGIPQRIFSERSLRSAPKRWIR